MLQILQRRNFAEENRRAIFSIHGSNSKEEGEEISEYELPDDRYRPDIQTDSNIKSEIIQKALLKVKPIYRELIILRDIQELSYEEIAEITGLKIGTVKSRINRGRARLQELLKDIYYE